MKYELKQVISDKLPGGMAYFLVEVTEGYDLIQVKRGLKADLPNVDLQVGEPAFCTDTHEFYVGGVNGQKHCINNGGSVADYETLYNLPKINHITLVGDVDLATLGIMSAEEIALALDAKAGILADTTANWEAQSTLKSVAGVLYVYTDHRSDNGVNIPAVKIGDGVNLLANIPFTSTVTPSDITNWNGKVAARVVGTTLELY